MCCVVHVIDVNCAYVCIHITVVYVFTYFASHCVIIIHLYDIDVCISRCVPSIHDYVMMYVGTNWDQHWAPFASNIALEIYHNVLTGGQAMRILYNGNVLRMQGCVSTDMCDMEIVMKTLNGIAPSDLVARCNHASN